MDDGYPLLPIFFGVPILVVEVTLFAIAVCLVGVLLWGLDQAIASALDRLVARLRTHRKAS